MVCFSSLVMVNFFSFQSSNVGFLCLLENDLFNNLDNDLTVEKHWRYWMDGTDSVSWFDTFVR